MLDIDASGVITDIDPMAVWHRQRDAARQAEREATARAARQRREEAGRLQVEEAEAVRMMKSADPVPGYQRFCAALARRHHITVIEQTTMPNGAEAFFDWRKHTAVVPPIVNEETFVIRLHEFGHGLAGKCPETEPHRRNLAVRNWWHCLECERLAWERAMDIAPVFTRGMFAQLQRSLAFHLHTTPSAASTVAAVNALSSNRTYCEDQLARIKHQDRLGWLRRVKLEIEQGR